VIALAGNSFYLTGSGINRQTTAEPQRYKYQGSTGVCSLLRHPSHGDCTQRGRRKDDG
jgi:hypothetical protein